MFKSELDLIEYIETCNKDHRYLDGLNAILENNDIIMKKYYEVIRYKISFLIELDKYIDASMIIKEELDVPYIPLEFEKFLKEKQKEVSFALTDKFRKDVTIEDVNQIDKLDNDALLAFIPHLNDFNLQKFTDKFQNIFNSKQISNLVKSLLIAALSDYKLNYNFTIVKEDTTIKFNPSTVLDIRESDNVNYIESKLKDFHDLEINIIDIIRKLCMTYLLDIYPLVISEDKCDILLLASIKLTSEMVNRKINYKEFDELYNKNYEKIEEFCNKLNNLLENN